MRASRSVEKPRSWPFRIFETSGCFSPVLSASCSCISPDFAHHIAHRAQERSPQEEFIGIRQIQIGENVVAHD
jgi:hypothetical protein